MILSVATIVLWVRSYGKSRWIVGDKLELPRASKPYRVVHRFRSYDGCLTYGELSVTPVGHSRSSPASPDVGDPPPTPEEQFQARFRTDIDLHSEGRIPILSESSGRFGFAIAAYTSSSSMPPSGHYWWIAIPHWFMALLFAAPALRWLWNRRPRPHSGTCPSCGYDLRATPTRCPECGTPVATGSGTATAAAGR